MDKNLIWAITIFLICLIISGALIWISYNLWTLRFEMDENTKEPIESIEWKEINYNNDYDENCKRVPCSCHNDNPSCALYCMQCILDEEVQ